MNLSSLPLFIAATDVVSVAKGITPAALVAALAITLEIVLNHLDKTFALCWWFFFSCLWLIVSDIAWISWVSGTNMAELLAYGAGSAPLIASVFAFLVISSLVLLGMLYAGTRRSLIENTDSGWPFAFLRLAPLPLILTLAIWIVIRSNAMVGEHGFINQLSSF